MSRTEFVPSHTGDNVLPADPLFTRLLTLAHHPQQSPAIRDLNAGVEKTSAELLSDVLNFRRVLKAALKAETRKDLENGKEIFISILAPGGYEFTVGVLAILALGAGASAISVLQPVSEASYYVNKARSVAVVVATPALEMGNALVQEIRKTTNPNFVAVPIRSYTEHPPILPTDVFISTNRYTDPNTAGIIIFTSGTTGPPKAAVLKLASLTDGSMSFGQQLGLREKDTLLHLVPVHHATGIWVSFFPFIQTGACIEFRSGSFDAAWTWDRFRRGGITHFSGVPTIYMRMMRYYQEHISKLSPEEVKRYRAGAAGIRTCICGTSALPKPIDDFWTEIRNGHRIVQRYGSTESGVVFNMPFENNEDVPDGAVGQASIGVDVKLSEGDEGEVLVKSFAMFSKYLHDPDATRNAHDAEGYFKSGDIARREGKYYFITGRASVDIIKSGGYKISALDIEREILALPYISEVMVVGVPDDEFGQRVAAVVSLRTDEVAQQFFTQQNRDPQQPLQLDDLRADVRGRLAGYKLPTLLRIISGELPKSPTGKVVKKTLGPKYFPKNYVDDPEVQVWNSSSGKKRTRKDAKL